jgi:aldose 1-epimerase
MAFDDVFTVLQFSDGVCTCRVIDPNSGRQLEVAFDNAFSQCVVYNPPHREAVCIEPYTCVPNSPELHEAGIDTGLRVLQPGVSFKARMAIRVE